MVQAVKNLKSYVRNKDILEISSDQSRRQKENLKTCYQKLDGSLIQVATDGVAKEVADHRATLSPKET